MYDHIEGLVVDAQPARAVLRAHGVGYELKVPLPTSRDLRPGSTATLFTVLHVVDGTPTLLGFATRPERDLARKLMTVAGVGPTVCLAVLSTFSPEQVVGAILAADAHSLRRVRGVGPKLADRMCLELREPMARFELRPTAEPKVTLLPRTTEDAIAGLVVLGYGEKEARAKVGKVMAEGRGASTEEIMRAVLQG
jgi:Holliday junction DNA helicase RuvA